MVDTILCLSIDTCSRSESKFLAWRWAITVTDSVFGTVLNSILPHDHGISLAAMLGTVAYFLGMAATLDGKAIARAVSW